jgi:hypothetical protein
MAVKSTVGIVVAVNNGSAYNNIANIDEFNSEPGDAEKIDATPLGATAKTTENGFSDYGTLSVTLFWDGADTTHEFLRTSAVNKSTVPIKVTLPSGFGKNTITYNVALSSAAPKTPKNDMIRLEIKGNLNGEPAVA